MKLENVTVLHGLLPVLWVMLIPAMAWLDRQRGSSDENETITKAVALAGLGVSVAVLLGAYNVSAITVIAVVWTAYVIGWGEPLGRIVSGGITDYKYETWQVGPMKDHPYLSMTVRGMLILPIALVANAAVALSAMLYAPLDALAIPAVDIAKLSIAFAVAFPLAPFIAVSLGRRGDHAWALQEYIRSGLIATMLLISKIFNAVVI